MSYMHTGKTRLVPQVAQHDAFVSSPGLGSAAYAVPVSAMAGSGGLALFGMGLNTPPGVHGRCGVLQSMLCFATESKYQEDGRKSGQSRISMGSIGQEVEGNGGAREAAAPSGYGEKQKQKETGLTRANSGWNKAFWSKHLWTKNRRSRGKKLRRADGGTRANVPRKLKPSRFHNEKNGGSCKSPTEGKRPLNKVLEQAKDKRWRLSAKSKFLAKFFAESTWASKDSKRRRVMEIASTLEIQLTPVNAETIVEVATVLDEAKLKSADQYLAEIKWMHIEENYKWDEFLERRLAQCKRALKRDSGPERRAKEVKLESIDERTWQKKGGGGQKAPLRVAWSYAWAMVWMLRSVEAAAVKVRHVKLDWSERKVELTIPKSKMDQAGKGVRRTLACCGASVCGRACAWWLAVRAFSEAGSSEEGPLFPMTGGGRCSRLQLVASWQKELDGDMTGHSGRRSGAMMYARNGLQLFDVAFLGRWKSSAVMRYIEEAMEQLAINQRAVANQQVPYSNAGAK